MSIKQTVRSVNENGAIHSDVVEYGSRRTLIVAGVMLATLLQVLDTTIVNVALPTIQGNLGASLDEATWVVTGYIIAAVIVIPLTPWLQMRFGRRGYYIAAILGFTVTSAACGLSTSFNELVFFRILQGACGGGLIATGQAVLRDTFPAKDLAKSQALNAVGAIVGPTIGPTLGGILTDALSWNWVFYINIVPGVISALLLFFFLRNPAQARKARVDGVGLGLLALGLGSLQYVLNEGERRGWYGDERIAVLSLLAAGGLAAFTWWELYVAEQPIVDLRILRNPTVTAGTLLGIALGFSLFGAIVIGPQFAQGILGFTATLSGEQILMRALAILAGVPFVLWLLNRGVDKRLLLFSGFLMLALANWMQAGVTTSVSGFWDFFVPLALGGVGLAQLFTPLATAVLASVHGADTPKAAALLSLSNQLGGSISTAVLITLLDRRTDLHYASLAATATLRNPAVQAFVQHHGSAPGLCRMIVEQATTLAFADAYRVLAVLTAAAIPLILLLRRSAAAHSAQNLPAFAAAE